MRAADLKRPEALAGIAAVPALVKLAGAISSETCGRFNAEDNVTPENWVDDRDYERIADCVADVLQRNFVDGPPRQRRAFLLALADLFALLGDGCAVSEDWDPAETLERAMYGQATRCGSMRRSGNGTEPPPVAVTTK